MTSTLSASGNSWTMPSVHATCLSQKRPSASTEAEKRQWLGDKPATAPRPRLPHGGGVREEGVRREVKCLEDERLRLAPEVMGGDHAAAREDRRLEQRIRELAGSERGHHLRG